MCGTENAQMRVSIRNTRTIKELVIPTVSFSFFGGTWIGMGIEHMIFRRAENNWTSDFLMGFAFLGFGIFWALMLLRRVRAELSK
jgi:hypothetical protein